MPETEIERAHRIRRKSDEALREWESDEKRKGRKDQRPTQAEDLVRLTEQVELFHSEGQGYASIPVDGHRENWPLKSPGFGRWLKRQYYNVYQKVPGSQAYQDALGAIEGKAFYENLEQPVFVRIAHVASDTIFVDLANSEWEAVEITPQGWQITENPAVRFRRPKALAPLPRPAKGGNLAELRELVNLREDRDWQLAVAWLLGTFTKGPYPVLCIQGTQGSAKSTTARLFRSLVDPNTSPLRATPRNAQDLMIAANNSWVLAFDNLSRVDDWLSDALCRLSTGGGFASRQLYSDSEEAIFSSTRPIILNGIDEVTGRNDLIDRSIVLSLAEIPEEKRRPESEVWAAFEAMRPRLLGALLDLVSFGLRQAGQIRPAKLPRMADFAIWVANIESAAGWESGSFLTAYSGNRAEAIELAIENDELAQLIRRVADRGDILEGSATEILGRLEEEMGLSVKDKKWWPRSASAFSGRLRRAKPFLASVGVEITNSRAGSRRNIRIQSRLETGGKTPSQASLPSHEDSFLLSNGQKPSDGDGDGDDGTPPTPEIAVTRSQQEGSDGSDDDDGESRLLSNPPSNSAMEDGSGASGASNGRVAP